MRPSIKLSVLAAVIASSGAVAYAYAAGDRQENDAGTIDKSRISLAQAVTIAEGHVQGKASRRV